MSIRLLEEEEEIVAETPLLSPSLSSEELFVVKVSLVLFGETGVGKSALTRRFSGNEFVDVVNPTRSTKKYTAARVTVDERNVDLEISDTAGEANFRKGLMDEFLKDCDGCMIVYDPGNRRSFRMVTNLYRSVKKICHPDVVVYLISNKINDNNQNINSEKKKSSVIQVSTEKGKEMALKIGGGENTNKNSVRFFEVSARDGTDEMFKEIISTYIRDCLQVIRIRKETILNLASNLFLQDNKNNKSTTPNDESLRIAEDLRDNENALKSAMEGDWRVLRLATSRLRNKKELVLSAIHHHGDALQFASLTLQNDRSVVLTALKRNETAFQFASRALRKDRDFVLNKVIKRNVYAVRYANRAVQQDPRVMIACLKKLGYGNLLNNEDRKSNFKLLSFTFRNLIEKKFRVIFNYLQNGNVYLGHVKKKKDIKKDSEEDSEEEEEEGELVFNNDNDSEEEEYIPFGFGFELKKVRKSKLSMKKSWVRKFSGYFFNGKRNGKGKEYHESSNQISFQGNFEDDKRNGKGREFQIISNHSRVVFQGTFINDKRHGMGEYYDKEKDKYVQGLWEKGDLKEVKFEYSIKFSDFSEIQNLIKYNKPDNLLGMGTYGHILRVRTKDIPSLMSSSSSDDDTDSTTTTTINNKKHEFVSLKVFKKELTDDQYTRRVLLSDIKRSLELCSHLQCKHIIKIIGVFVGVKRIAYAMELCSNSVDKIIRASNFTLGYDEKRRILYEVALGMKSLHSINVMHRDLKWGNVLLDSSGTVKITDFETLKEDQNEWRWGRVVHTATGRGTPAFLAPERTNMLQLRNKISKQKKTKKNNNNNNNQQQSKDQQIILDSYVTPLVTSCISYSLPVDVFSYGLMIFCLLFEKGNPFEDNYRCSCGASTKSFSEYSIVEHVRDCDYRPLLDTSKVDRIPSEFQFLCPLMTLCWERDPSKRPKFSEIVKIFEDEQKKRKRYCIMSVRLEIKITTTTIIENQQQQQQQQQKPGEEIFEQTTSSTKVQQQQKKIFSNTSIIKKIKGRFRLLLLEPKINVLMRILEDRFPHCQILSIEHDDDDEEEESEEEEEDNIYNYNRIKSDEQLFQLMETEEEPKLKVIIDQDPNYNNNNNILSSEKSSGTSSSSGHHQQHYTLRTRNEMLMEEISLLKEEVARHGELVESLRREKNDVESKYERAIKMRDQLDKMNRKMLSVMKFRSSLNKK